MTRAIRRMMRAQLSATTLVLVFSVPISAAETTSNQGWRISQASQIHGPIDCYIGAIGVRLEMKDLSIIAKTPFKGVDMINRTNRCFMAQSNELAAKKTQWGSLPAGKISFVKLGTGTVAGLQATRYERRVTTPAGKVLKTGEAWLTRDLKLPPRSHDAIARLLNVPPELGMPLRLIGLTPRGQRITYMDSYDARRVQLKPANFARPKGFREVKDEVALILDTETQKALEADKDFSSLVGNTR